MQTKIGMKLLEFNGRFLSGALGLPSFTANLHEDDQTSTMLNKQPGVLSPLQPTADSPKHHSDGGPKTTRSWTGFSETQRVLQIITDNAGRWQTISGGLPIKVTQRVSTMRFAGALC